MAVGAILVQRTNWRNAERALSSLKKRRLMNPEGLASMGVEELAEVISSAGLPVQKARRLKLFCTALLEKYGSLQELLSHPEGRGILLSIEGIGEETADSMLLYAGDQPTLPVGEYTRRVLERMGLQRRGYGEWRATLLKALPPDTASYKEFHALFVAHGKRFCRKKPLCPPCPLLDLCKHGRERVKEARG